jgi:hypothetical protein
MVKITIKEISKWMKTLEENRYKKIYNADAKRVTWFVNNQMSENTETMPKSYRKRWTEAKYNKERYLAKKFMESKDMKINESKIREMIRKVIKEGLSDGTIEWENNRQQQSEVLGYKLTGKSDHKVKPNALTQQVGFRKNN